MEEWGWLGAELIKGTSAASTGTKNRLLGNMIEERSEKEIRIEDIG